MTTPLIAHGVEPSHRFQTKLGPLASWGGQFFVFMALTLLFQPTGPDLFPHVTSYALLAGVFGITLLAPRQVILRMPISISVTLMIGWLITSIAWTDSEAGSIFILTRNVPLYVGMGIIIAMLDVPKLLRALLWQIRFSVILSLIVVAVDPKTRVHLDDAGQLVIDGWHALFPHKNIMAPYLVFAVATVLTFERNRAMRWLTFVGISVLLVGSDSVTGMASAVLVVGVWIWVQLFQNLDVRNSSLFTIATGAFSIFGLIAAALSIGEIVSASGKNLTFTGRTYIWDATLTAWRQRPIFGYGYGGVLGSNPVTPKTAEVWRDIGFDVPHAHSGTIDVLLQLGVIGLIIFAILWVSVLLGATKMLRERQELAAWIISVCAVQLFISLSENVFLGSGWLAVIIMFRVLLARKHGLDYETQNRIEERVRLRQVAAARRNAYSGI